MGYCNSMPCAANACANLVCLADKFNTCTLCIRSLILYESVDTNFNRHRSHAALGVHAAVIGNQLAEMLSATVCWRHAKPACPVITRLAGVGML